MSNRTSPNALIRQRYRTGQRVVARDEGRALTQREFLDVAFGNNPRTGKPYNTRTLRKWLNGERDATKAVQQSKSRTYTITQNVKLGDRYESTNLVKPSNRSGLDLFTPAGRKRVRRTTRAGILHRVKKVSPDRADTVERDLRTLELRNARAPKRTSVPGIIISRTTRMPLAYIAG